MERCTPIEQLDLGRLPHNESGQPMLDGGRLVSGASHWRSDIVAAELLEQVADVRDSAAAGISVDWMREGVDTFTYWATIRCSLRSWVLRRTTTGCSRGCTFYRCCGCIRRCSIWRSGAPLLGWLARDIAGPLFAPPAQSEAARHLTFSPYWGITCAARDNLVNIHLVVLSKKRIRLASGGGLRLRRGQALIHPRDRLGARSPRRLPRLAHTRAPCRSQPVAGRPSSSLRVGSTSLRRSSQVLR